MIALRSISKWIVIWHKRFRSKINLFLKYKYIWNKIETVLTLKWWDIFYRKPRIRFILSPASDFTSIDKIFSLTSSDRRCQNTHTWFRILKVIDNSVFVTVVSIWENHFSVFVENWGNCFFLLYDNRNWWQQIPEKLKTMNDKAITPQIRSSVFGWVIVFSGLQNPEKSVRSRWSRSNLPGSCRKRFWHRSVILMNAQIDPFQVLNTCDIFDTRVGALQFPTTRGTLVRIRRILKRIFHLKSVKNVKKKNAKVTFLMFLSKNNYPEWLYNLIPNPLHTTSSGH